MAIRVVEFSETGAIKSERFLPKNQHTQGKLLNFENWVNWRYQKVYPPFENSTTLIAITVYASMVFWSFTNFLLAKFKQEIWKKEAVQIVLFFLQWPRNSPVIRWKRGYLLAATFCACISFLNLPLKVGTYLIKRSLPLFSWTLCTFSKCCLNFHFLGNFLSQTSQ